ncbi:hypothetical protein GCM10027046_19690 [Uliginosibacterium flavum]|uniref:DUF1924 domain-containing protein n=1 Tax=Uliginosibacterium flavum TaxID=1396831 RepID=A0ABV2TFW1_9RHOO
MSKPRLSLRHCLALVLLCAAALAQAETPQQILSVYESAARVQAPAFSASAVRGGDFFRNKHGREWSCASCHTGNPVDAGKHASTGKAIQPMAVAANAERFTQPNKVEKWFTRNCKDVLGRECSAAEKADVVAFLSTVK